MSLVLEHLRPKYHYQLELESSQTKFIYLHGIFYLLGELSLLGENSLGLVEAIPLKSVKKCLPLAAKKNVMRSMAEIFCFISQARDFHDLKARIIFKYNYDAKIDLFPPYHYFEGPSVVEGPKGSWIWGATVEESAPIYDWLYKIRDHISLL